MVAGVRRFRPADLAAIRAIMDTALETDRPAGWDRRLIERSLERIPADAAGVLVATEAGTVVGYCVPRLDDLTVHPDHRRRGHGRRLVAGALELVRRRGLTELELYGPSDHPAAQAFLRTLGFTYRSSLWRLALPPDVGVAHARFPPEVHARAFRPGEDEPDLVRLANESFADHPTPVHFEEAFIRRINALPSFNPDGVRLLSPVGHPEELVAFARAETELDDGGRLVGDVRLIGVLAPWRRRGLGRELLRWSIGWLRDRGAERIELGVEARNERALELYRRTGFVPDLEWPHWILPA